MCVFEYHLSILFTQPNPFYFLKKKSNEKKEKKRKKKCAALTRKKKIKLSFVSFWFNVSFSFP